MLARLHRVTGMSGNSFGHALRITSFGESHGRAMGVIIDGCPPGLELSEQDLLADLERRRPGKSRLSSSRKEADLPRILSGVAEGRTLGTPIAIVFENSDAKPKAYANTQDLYRPSHADYTYEAKYGHRAKTGGGRASARETVARVAAGAIAKKLLRDTFGVEVIAWVERAGGIQAQVDTNTVTQQMVADSGAIQCPDPDGAAEMTAAIEQARKDGDTIGGIIRCVIRNVPVGLGDPVFDKFEAQLAKAMLSLPAAKAFDIGSGFLGTDMRGSEHNDPFVPDGEGGVATTTNRSGGVQGGITNGMPIVFRVGFKPVATHFQPQSTVNIDGEAAVFQAKGRHDPCVLPRAAVIVEAMAALVVCDFWMRHRGQVG